MDILVNGVVLGLAYCLLGVGLSLILGVGRVVDIAYFSYYLLAAYMVYWLIPLPFVPVWLAFVIGAVAAVALCLVVHFFLILPIRERPFVVLVSTIAVAMVVQEILIFKEGWSEPIFIPSVLTGATSILGIWIANGRLLVAGVTVGIMGLLWLLFSKTKLGLAIRAVAEQPEAMQLVGGNVRQVCLYAAILASLLAGIAGLLLGSVYPPHPYVWLDLLIIAFAVMVLGGLGNLWGVLPAGLILGISEVLFAVYVPFGAILKRSVGLIIILLVLVFRPTGLFGVKGWEH